MGHRTNLADELRSMAGDVEALEEDYDNLVAELEEDKNEIDKLRDELTELKKYLDWAESYYPDMLGQYTAICRVVG